MSREALQGLIALAQEHDFVIASDECYSEIYPDEQLSARRLARSRRRHGQYRLPALSVLSQSVKAIQSCPGCDLASLPAIRTGLTSSGVTAPITAARCPRITRLPASGRGATSSMCVDNRARYREKFAAVTPILTPVLATPSPEAGFYSVARDADRRRNLCPAPAGAWRRQSTARSLPRSGHRGR